VAEPLKHPDEDFGTPAPLPGGIAARAQAGASRRYLDGLNPEQREAVETLEGPVLVLAGAGTGKTRVLTTRIAHILSLGRARPSEILAVTFTNKAAREMKARIALMVGHAVEGMPWLGTFHSIGVKILRRHAEMVDLKSDFTILDVDDQIRLLKQLLEAENVDEKRWPARVLAGFIDNWKNRGLVPAQVPAGEAAAFAGGRGAKLYAAYQARLKVLNAADFGDLLLEMIRLFREQPSVLRHYQQRFRYMLVDEYQDTNVAQYLWLRLLAQRSRRQPAQQDDPGLILRGAALHAAPQDEDRGPRGDDDDPHPEERRATPRVSRGEAEAVRPAPANLCCVGDDDQSIYGWRGAEVDNILRFEHDFPGAKVIRLERNYRSTAHILAAAAHLIAHNEGRLGKTLRTEDEAGEKVTVTGAWDSEEEARAVGEEIEQLQRHGHALNEVAILVRASFQMREFEDRFITTGLPYRVIGGPRFYERAEIRDALAYLRLVNQPADDLAFDRIVNVPRRGLGDATLRVLHDHARTRGVPLMEAARVMVETEELGVKPRGALRNLIAAFDRWRARKDAVPHTELAETVLDESGYTEMWQKDRSADAAGRLENLKELIRSMEEFENLQGFLEHIALVMERETAENTDAVSIMTLHSAKGLEFDSVFLPGWEEGLFPHPRALDEQGRAGLEEERRLAHVGITRARRRAKISFATNRRMRGSWSTNIPSRFVDELPEAHVEVVEPQGGFGGYGGYGASRFDDAVSFGSSYTTPGWQRAQARRRQEREEFVDDELGDRPAAASAPSRRARDRQGVAGTRGRTRQGPLTIEGELVAKSTGTVSPFGVGDRVFHLKFGNGNVTAVDGNKLTIAFDKAGEKRVVDSFVERV
jgi:DNA helicase II / ATP-dependent DNA helicase PcrA